MPTTVEPSELDNNDNETSNNHDTEHYNEDVNEQEWNGENSKVKKRLMRIKIKVKKRIMRIKIKVKKGLVRMRIAMKKRF